MTSRRPSSKSSRKSQYHKNKSLQPSKIAKNERLYSLRIRPSRRPSRVENMLLSTESSEIGIISKLSSSKSSLRKLTRSRSLKRRSKSRTPSTKSTENGRSMHNLMRGDQSSRKIRVSLSKEFTHNKNRGRYPHKGSDGSYTKRDNKIQSSRGPDSQSKKMVHKDQKKVLSNKTSETSMCQDCQHSKRRRSRPLREVNKLSDSKSSGTWMMSSRRSFSSERSRRSKSYKDSSRIYSSLSKTGSKGVYLSRQKLKSDKMGSFISSEGSEIKISSELPPPILIDKLKKLEILYTKYYTKKAAAPIVILSKHLEFIEKCYQQFESYLTRIN